MSDGLTIGPKPGTAIMNSLKNAMRSVENAMEQDNRQSPEISGPPAEAGKPVPTPMPFEVPGNGSAGHSNKINYLA